MDAKVSFGFKKLPKKSAVIGAKPPEPEKLELIQCIDSQSIKLVGHEEDKPQPEKIPLVIALLGKDKTLLDRIKDAEDLKARSLKKKQEERPAEEPEDTRPDSELSIEELAARKLIQEAENYKSRTSSSNKVHSIAIEDQLILEGAAESSLADYEAIPINDYGYAMLRGMGWKEDSTKNNAKVKTPDLRPKGMGLGASVSGGQITRIPKDKHGKELKLIKGAKAKVVAGKEKGSYGIVQGLDDDAGRIIIRMTLTGSILSLHEFMLLPVTHEEYAQCANVLNNAKFEKYRNKNKNCKPEKKVREEKDNDNNGEVEYVPNNVSKIEISSESEEERRKDSHDRKRSKSRLRNRHSSRSKDARSTNKYSDDELSAEEHKQRHKQSKSKKDKKHKMKKHHKKSSRHRNRSENNSESSSCSDSSR